MNLSSELKLLVRLWLGILLYIVLLGIVQHDWGSAIIQGLLWGLAMSVVLPWIQGWVAERELRRKLNDRE